MRKEDKYQIDQKLASIQKVEASEFLFTRIQQKIANKNIESISKPWAFALSAAFVLLFTINIFAFSKWNSTSNSNNNNNLVQELNISTNNNLYN